MEEVKRRPGTYDRFKVEADENILKRAATTERGKVQICPDKEEIKKYIKKRLRESGISQDRIATYFGTTPTYFKMSLGPNFATSYEKLGEYLWVIDGDDCPYQYKGLNELNEEGD